MDEVEITNLFFSNPDLLFQEVEKRGGSLNELKNKRLGKLLVQERFPGLVNLDTESAVDFVFWFTYWVETELKNDILYVEKRLGKSASAIEMMLDEKTFGDKIKFIELNYIDNRKKDDYVQVLREVKNLRNHLAHGRLDKLQYGGYALSDPRGQLKIIVQLHNAALRKPLI